MKVLITSSKTKPRLVQAFKDAGANVVDRLEADVKLIIPTVDEELPFFSRAKDYFKSCGIAVNVSQPYTIDVCRDKAEFYRVCRRFGIPVPVTGQFEAIIKPRFGKGSKDIIKIDKSYLVQELISWPEYSIDYLADFDGNFLSAIPRKRLAVVNGESTAGEINLHPALVNWARKLGEDLQLCGHNTIQCFFDGEKGLFSEVNCRFGGGFWITQPHYNTVQRLLNLVKEGLKP
jgi:carbamoyl-phosphate synthase large subunit